VVDIYLIAAERLMSVQSARAERHIVHVLTFLILAAAFLFALFLSLVKMIWNLSQLSIHESPGILETDGESPSGQDQATKTVNRRVLMG
jgi:multisubunit Na+/H+ antiporter MnhE subunit